MRQAEKIASRALAGQRAGAGFPGRAIRKVEGRAAAPRAPPRRRTRAAGRRCRRPAACARAGRRSRCCGTAAPCTSVRSSALVAIAPTYARGRRDEPSCVITRALRGTRAARGEADQRMARGAERGRRGAAERPPQTESLAGSSPSAGAASPRRAGPGVAASSSSSSRGRARLQQRDLLLQLVRAEAVVERRGDGAGVETGEERDDPLDRVDARGSRRDRPRARRDGGGGRGVRRRATQLGIGHLVRARDEGRGGRARPERALGRSREQGESSRLHVSTQR